MDAAAEKRRLLSIVQKVRQTNTFYAVTARKVSVYTVCLYVSLLGSFVFSKRNEARCARLKALSTNFGSGHPNSQLPIPGG